jgi:hypothetical protein
LFGFCQQYTAKIDFNEHPFFGIFILFICHPNPGQNPNTNHNNHNTSNHNNADKNYWEEADSGRNHDEKQEKEYHSRSTNGGNWRGKWSKSKT